MKKLIAVLAILLLVTEARSQTKTVRKTTTRAVKPHNTVVTSKQSVKPGTKNSASASQSHQTIPNNSFEGAEKALLLKPKTKTIKN